MKRPFLLLTALAVSSLPLHARPRAQEPEPLPPSEKDEPAALEPAAGPAAGIGGLQLDQTVVTARRTRQRAFDAPYAVDTVPAEEIRRRAYRTTPQALRDVPGVLVQETSPGQGSPYIRGFTAFRNVFLIDGIRLNNSVFRDGPNQYWNTVDPLTIERLEVVKGPSSVLYGSDAIGGTVNAITASPYGHGPGWNLGGRAYYRVSSAEESHTGRLELSSTWGDDWGLLVGGTGRHFGDMEGGHDIGEQPNTGYDEHDGDIKLEHFLDPDTRLVFGYQHVFQNNVPRTHSTIFADPFEGTTVGSDLKRDLDQRRELTYAQIHGERVDSFFDSYSVSVSWHDQEEVEDRIRSNMTRDKQGFDVGTLGFFAHLSSDTSIGRLTYGVDLYHDEVDSFSTGNTVQGPVADDATYDLAGLFLQDEIRATERLTLVLGGRYEYAAADADSVLDPVSGTPTSIDDDWGAAVGSARFTYALVEDSVNLFGGVSQGFRAPNLSDLTRFDSARSNEFEIPSPGLDPEHYISYELGVKTRSERLSTEVSLFYTDIEDQIVRFPTGNVNGMGQFEITKDNVGDGYVYGVELGAAWELRPQWTLFGNTTWMEGKVETFPTSAPIIDEEYIDRLMPWTTQAGVRWESRDGGAWAELQGVYADDADRLSTRDQSDTQRIPPGGTPSYVVAHLRGGVRLSEALRLDLGLENLTDEDYRVHGSGSNMPGRNFIVGLTASF